ncbi:MAG TPA: hypothetical protein VFS25_00465 [Chitinophaga sp.]|jgi:hypothetical protein|uniref:hypothetical protein n=1 Tax=Chitinophaga sp. TaxID=1869181 RepID=UPI002DB8BF44|nr:hypothetical protein [Chitinophaga sp.]HEU4551266.1 hypothetical protein [Chitinophaga sp.]
MEERKDKPLPQEKDRHLDVPAEANRDKHINFPSLDEDGDTGQEEPPRPDKATEERQKKWKETLDTDKEQRERV